MEFTPRLTSTFASFWNQTFSEQSRFLKNIMNRPLRLLVILLILLLFSCATPGEKVIYFGDEIYDHSISSNTKALEKNSMDAEAYNDRGVAYHEKGLYDEAISDFSKAIEINPKDADAYYNRGTVYGIKGQYDQAISDYNKALEINPRFALAYDNRGNAYSESGRYDEAISDHNKAIEINPKGCYCWRGPGELPTRKKVNMIRQSQITTRPLR